MSQYQPEGFSDGEWDDREDLSWNEYDWQQFLRRQQKEIARFSNHYLKHCYDTDHLDTIAKEMGWEVGDWSAVDPDTDDETDAAREEECGDFDPYTIHRHPVFVVTAGIFAQLRFIAETLLARGRMQTVCAKSLWNFGQALGDGERNMLLALQSLDMGDFMLSVIHLKYAMRSINECMRWSEALVGQADHAHEFRLESRIRLFDLREVCLRLISDCREEERRGFRDND